MFFTSASHRSPVVVSSVRLRASIGLTMIRLHQSYHSRWCNLYHFISGVKNLMFSIKYKIYFPVFSGREVLYRPKVQNFPFSEIKSFFVSHGSHGHNRMPDRWISYNNSSIFFYHATDFDSTNTVHLLSDWLVIQYKCRDENPRYGTSQSRNLIWHDELEKTVVYPGWRSDGTEEMGKGQGG
jgi:hypothetical protein